MNKENLLKLLNAHGVEYVLIGATAFPVHGYARATLDIDIFIRPVRSNAERALAALAAFGYDVTDITTDDLLAYKILVRQYIVELDVHPFVKGVDFDEVWNNRVSGAFGEVPVFYASLDDLITMKRAAGRPKDLEDLRALERIKAKKRG